MFPQDLRHRLPGPLKHGHGLGSGKLRLPHPPRLASQSKLYPD
jgi:hypothetical protein